MSDMEERRKLTEPEHGSCLSVRRLADSLTVWTFDQTIGNRRLFRDSQPLRAGKLSPALAASFCTLSPAMVDFTQSLPSELLIQILCHVSIPDILRLKRVKRLSLWWTNLLSTIDICRLAMSFATLSSHLR